MNIYAQLENKNGQSSDNVQKSSDNQTTPSSDVAVSDKEEDKEEDKEIEIDIRETLM